jgi:pyruvate/2-oxoglutarate dehydrogenase complex dihydrolipoamide dehydrogenase (E3) component
MPNYLEHNNSSRLLCRCGMNELGNVVFQFGVASFIDANKVRVVSTRGQSEYQAQDIVIATGTKPAIVTSVPASMANA